MANVIMAGTDGQFGNLFALCREAGHDVVVLDCFSDTHAALTRQFGDSLIQCGAHRQEVAKVTSGGAYDAGLVVDGGNHVRTGLMVQAMHDANIEFICVVTANRQFAKLYRKIAGQAVAVVGTGLEALRRLARLAQTNHATTACHIARMATRGAASALPSTEGLRLSLQL